MINRLINELMAYGMREYLVDEDDKVYVKNRLLDLFGQIEFEEEEVTEERALVDILSDMCKYAYEKGIIEDDTVTMTDLFDTKIMGQLTPMPSTVRRMFKEIYHISSKLATDFYYKFSKRTNYIRTDRIAKDEKWVTQTEYGPIDITINLSKPEKDPRDIAKAGQAKKSGYPSCLLCMENEGYAEGAYEELDTADNGYLATWIHADEVGRKQLDTVGREQELFEGRTIHLLQELLPQHSQIVVANSMSIRDMDYFWSGNRHSAIIYGNRGVNGIDGTVSTALGIATNGMPTVLLTGDLTFFHDLNGLAVAKTHPLNVTIIVHNNDGGGIFEYLPQKGTPHFDYLFSTAQGLDYSGLATLYGIDFVRVASNDELKNALQNYVGTMGVHVIEIPTSKERSRELHKKYTTIPTNKEDRL